MKSKLNNFFALTTEPEEKYALWPDGTWCNYDQIEEMLSFMSDDYQIVHICPDELEEDHFYRSE